MWKDLFPDTYYMNGYADYRGVNRVEQRMEMITDRLVEEYEVTSSTVRNEYPETISENVPVNIRDEEQTRGQVCCVSDRTT